MPVAVLALGRDERSEQLVSGEVSSVDLWVYFVGPIVGGALGALIYDRLLRHSDPPEV